MNLTIAIDYLDLLMISDELFGEEHINKLLGEYAERGVTAIQWRVSVHGKLLYHSTLGDRFGETPISHYKLPQGFTKKFMPIYEKCKRILDINDPLEVAARLSRKHGLKFYPWLTIYDDAGFSHITWSRLLIDNPAYSWKLQDENVYYDGITSYVYPEVVNYRLAQIEEMLKYDCDGVYLSTRSHSRPPGYIESHMEFLKNHSWDDKWERSSYLESEFLECRGKFGFDPPAVEAYRQKSGRLPQPDDQSWWKFRGGYLTEFLRKGQSLATTYNKELCFGPHTPPRNVYPEGFFDWKRMLDENIVDELHFAATDTYFGNEEIEKEYPWLFNSSGRKNYFHCVKSAKSATDHIDRFESTGNSQFLSRFDGLTIFEAFHLILNPTLWEFVDHLKNYYQKKDN